jgi:hypothetical protein
MGVGIIIGVGCIVKCTASDSSTKEESMVVGGKSPASNQATKRSKSARDGFKRYNS